MPLKRNISVITFLLAAVLLVGGVTLHVCGEIAWGSDDAYISYRYARNLVEGHGLVFNPGERVEGYSNLLNVLCTAPAFWFLADEHIYFYSLVFNVLLMLLALLVFQQQVRRYLSPDWTLAACVLFALNPFIWRACTMGLETPMVVFIQLLIWKGVCQVEHRGSRSDLILLSVCIAASILSRADGFIAPAVAIAYLLLKRRWRAAMILSGVAAVVFGSYVSWRLWYYGYPLPNTYYAKVGGPLDMRIEKGYRQFKNIAIEGFWPYGVALLMPIALVIGKRLHYTAAVFKFMANTLDYLERYRSQIGTLLNVARKVQRWSRKAVERIASLKPYGQTVNRMFNASGSAILRPISYEVFAAGCWIGYFHYVGGDFLGTRFLLFLFPLGIFFLFRALSHLTQQRGPIMLVTALLIAWQLVPLFHNAHFNYTFEKYDAWKETGEFLAAEYPGKTIAVDAAGKMPFFSNLYTIDMLGLNDTYIAHKPTDHFIATGHNKWDTSYILERNPDVIAGFYYLDLDLQYGLTQEVYEAAGYRMAWIINLRDPIQGRMDVRDAPRDELQKMLNNNLKSILMAILEKKATGVHFQQK